MVVVKDTDPEYKALKESINKLDGLDVRVGVPDGAVNRRGVEISIYALFQDSSKGSHEGWIQSVQDAISGRVYDYAQSLITVATDKKSVEQAVKNVGIYMQGEYKKEVKKHGVYDTGDLYNSISYFLMGGIK